MTIKEIEKNIRKLPPAERLRIIENVIASLNEPDPAIEKAWGRESDKRLKAYHAGSLKATSLEKVKKRIAP